jgi:hypothetical protein
MSALMVRRFVAVLLVAAGAALVLPAARARQDGANGLKYRLRVAPGNLTVDRMPGPGPAKSYEEKFTFVVGNSATTEYDGTAPNCQTFDIVVAQVDKPDTPMWQWSHGQMFCMMVTPVKIAPGGRWVKSEVWKFAAADVPDGKYRATATFIPEHKTAAVEFEVTSVH